MIWFPQKRLLGGNEAAEAQSPHSPLGHSEEVEDQGRSRVGSGFWRPLQQKALRSLQSPHPSPAPGAPGPSAFEVSRPGLQILQSSVLTFLTLPGLSLVLSLDLLHQWSKSFYSPRCAIWAIWLMKVLFRVFIFQIFRKWPYCFLLLLFVLFCVSI